MNVSISVCHVRCPPYKGIRHFMLRKQGADKNPSAIYERILKKKIQFTGNCGKQECTVETK